MCLGHVNDGKGKAGVGDESAHNSLFEMAVSIVGEVIFYQRLDAFV